MMDSPTWQYDEMQQVGKDYANVYEVEQYDIRHSRFRNIEKENEAILNRLSVQKNHRVIDLGAGTGAFAIQAAKCGEKVYAVDISQAMLNYAQNKAITNGITNIIFCQGGFLTYQHQDAPVDFVVTSMALHHLPDFWKMVALQRINSLLKNGGQLFLVDVVFSTENYLTNIANWIAKLNNLGGKALAEDAERHVREEYSTFTWILEELLRKSGFQIENTDYDEGVLAKYFCTKISNCA